MSDSEQPPRSSAQAEKGMWEQSAPALVVGVWCAIVTLLVLFLTLLFSMSETLGDVKGDVRVLRAELRHVQEEIDRVESKLDSHITRESERR